MNNQDELRHRYLVNRRAFVGMAAAGAASPLLARAAAAQPAPKARNVALVHGLFADGSCWSKVIPSSAEGHQLHQRAEPLTRCMSVRGRAAGDRGAVGPRCSSATPSPE